METALNLCDLLPSKECCERLLNDASVGKKNYSRVYVGSYFCSNKYLSLKKKSCLDLLNRLASASIRVSLVLPVVTQKNWDGALGLADFLIKKYSNVIDELVVNDLGLLNYLYNKYSIELVAGRMLNKTYRDLRNKVYFDCPQTPKILNNFYDSIFKKCKIKKIELDNTASTTVIPSNYSEYTFCVHMPLCYITKCNICEFASIHKPIEHKFRASDGCCFECLNHFISYDSKNKDDQIKHYKIGCGVYFINETLGVKAEKMRIIENPFLEVLGHENISPIE